MKKFVLGAICTLATVGFVLADEFSAQVTKVDGSNITYFKTKGGFGGGGKGGGKGGKGGAQKDGDAVKATVVDGCKVLTGVFDMDSKGYKDGDPYEGGLKADAFKNASDDMPVNVRIFTADDGKDKGKITKILVTKGGFGKKGGGKKGG